MGIFKTPQKWPYSQKITVETSKSNGSIKNKTHKQEEKFSEKIEGI
jgi:hypothetical protein